MQSRPKSRPFAGDTFILVRSDHFLLFDCSSAWWSSLEAGLIRSSGITCRVDLIQSETVGCGAFTVDGCITNR